MAKNRKTEAGVSAAIVGASGMVGSELLHLLEKRNFPIRELLLFSSGKKGKFTVFRGKKFLCEKPDLKKLQKADLIFFVSTDEISAKYAPRLASAGKWCIDDSSKFRMDKKIPIIIPEINAHRINRHTKLVSGPNCTTAGAALALWNIHRKYKVKRLRFATYQAISGAGRGAMQQFESEILSYFKKSHILYKKNMYFPHPIAMNLFPQVGAFDKAGNSSEEVKMDLELKKIWNEKDIGISSFCVRVPVMRGHCIAAWVETERKWTLPGLRKTFSETPGIRFVDKGYFTPLMAEKKELTYVNRLQRSNAGSSEFKVWISMDNLYKGAALNSVQIAEYLLKKGYLEI